MDKGSGTASSMLWQIERILKECKELNCLPECLLLENVTNVHGKKNIKNWEYWISILDSLGYHTYYSDLNAKDYGIPQNRLRCYAISFLPNKSYTFPEPIELKYRLEDLLEDHVGDEFYINTEKAKKLIIELMDKGVLPLKKNIKDNRQGIDLTINDPRGIEIANCIKARYDANIVNFKADGTGVVEDDNR